MIKKFFSVTAFAIFFYTFCFAAPNPGGSASIRDGLPGSVSSPSIDREPLFSTPYPTNKWFTSLIHANTAQVSGVLPTKPALAMYTYPLVYTIPYQTDGIRKAIGCLVLGCPNLNVTSKCFTFASDVTTTSPFRDQLSVLPYKNEAVPSIAVNEVKLAAFSDWSCTIDNGYYKATIGQGMLFSFFEFKKDSELNALISGAKDATAFKVYSCDDSQEEWSYQERTTSFTGDKFVIELNINHTEYGVDISSTVYYGVFLAKDTTTIEPRISSKSVKINFVNNDTRYMSVALMTSKQDLQEFYKYAYNFIDNTETAKTTATTKIKNNMVETEFVFTFHEKRTTSQFVKNKTIFTVMPHHYKNGEASISYLDGGIGETNMFQTLRGKMKIAVGNSFTTRYKVQPIVPFFQYDLTDIKNQLSGYLGKDNSATPKSAIPSNTYEGGKVMAKLANMLPIADNLNDNAVKNDIIGKLKDILSNWFEYSVGENSKYFAYDSKWGGLIGIPVSYNSQKYNDHHFHYGYFIYTAAILTMYDKSFAKEYGGMVELLIKDIANSDRNDNNYFPYLRYFDIYEGHSWANGMGGDEISDGYFTYSDSIDEESSSEAMNAWSAIYLWGLATDNQKYIDLGLKLYTIHYNSLKDYYLDIDATKTDDSARIYPKDMEEGKYGDYGSVGILFGSRAKYEVWWDSGKNDTRQIKGIQVLPLTSAMASYWSYDLDYAQSFYEKMKAKEPSKITWNDIWSRLQSLYNPTLAQTTFMNGHSGNWEEWTSAEIDNGGSVSFTYHFINFFKKYGTPVFTYSADTPSYMVLVKDEIPTYCAYNFETTSKSVNFYDPSGEYLGYLFVPAKSFVLSPTLHKDEPGEKVSVYPVPFKPASGGRYDAEGITFSGLGENANIKIFNVAGEKVFEKTVSDSGIFVWDAKNNGGNDVASGIYIYYVKTGDGKKFKGKLAIER